MKLQIDTIPVNEAYETADECPFCYLQRQTEQKAIRYTAGPGASYMEPDVRGVTDRLGFCGDHFRKLYTYGNSLGNALMMQTYLIGLRKEMEQQLNDFELPAKKSLFGKKETEELPLVTWLKEKNGSCFLCNKIDYNMQRYYATFFHLIKDAQFREKVEASKGLCLCHIFFKRVQTCNGIIQTVLVCTKFTACRRNSFDCFIHTGDCCTCSSNLSYVNIINI